jgi:hypothetical protein
VKSAKDRSGLLAVIVYNIECGRWLFAYLLQAIGQFLEQFRVLAAVDGGVKSLNVGHGHMYGPIITVIPHGYVGIGGFSQFTHTHGDLNYLL